MAKNVVIVESPAKAKTIERYLGKDFHVQASMGHVRDLPEKELGVDIENAFRPRYVVPRAKQKVVTALKKAAAKADQVFMATDLDREGEAIAWHLCEALGLDAATVHRVVFNEITKPAIQEAFAAPGRIDLNKVSAQETRRILDRLVGYKLSPLLWKKVAKGLSAGRVQSVAVRLVVEREREIRAFRPEEYWTLDVLLSKPGETATFKAVLAEVDGQAFRPGSAGVCRPLADQMRRAAYRVRGVTARKAEDKAPPPFITSELQRAASMRLGFSADRTMRVAQQLYQGVELGPEGATALITYMRTDSHHVAAPALGAVREFIRREFGGEYLPQKPMFYRSRDRAQEAHEAIRPTDVNRTPDSVRPYLGRDEAALYELIWKQFVASQMLPALWHVTQADIEAAADSTRGLFKAHGRSLLYDGYTKVLGVRLGKDDQQLPVLAAGQPLDLKDLQEKQHFTQPPSRYTEATLVKTLEGLGIGRPSTYAAIISTIQERGYTKQEKNLFLRCEAYPACPYAIPCDVLRRPMWPVARKDADATATAAEAAPTAQNAGEALRGAPAEVGAAAQNGPPEYLCPACRKPLALREGQRCFFATELGEVVTDKLVQHFQDIMDVKFTSHMEDDLDQVEEAKIDSLSVIREFWEPFQADLKRAGDEMESAKHQPVESAGPCPECGAPLVQRWSKHGPFLGCSKYPDCKFIRSAEQEDRPRPKPTEHKCDKCGGTMLLRYSRRGEPFLGCENYPKCRSTLPCDKEGNPQRPEPTGEVCDKCGAPMVIKRSRRGPFLACSAYPKCRNAKSLGKGKEEGGTATGRSRKSAKGAGAPRRARAKPIDSGRTCPDCGQPLLVRTGRRGAFLGCSGYPKCRYTEDAPPGLVIPQPQEGV